MQTGETSPENEPECHYLFGIPMLKELKLEMWYWNRDPMIRVSISIYEKTIVTYPFSTEQLIKIL